MNTSALNKKRKYEAIDAATQSFKTLLADIISSKRNGNQTHGSKDKGTSLLLDLMRLSDFTKEEEEETKKATEYTQHLHPLDEQLEILRYEKESYKAEIEQCRQYGSSDISQLLSDETSNMDVGHSNRASSSASDEFHFYMMNALKEKLLEKQKLDKEVESLQEKKQQLKEVVATATKRLASVDLKLKTLAKNSALFQPQYIQVVPFKQVKIPVTSAHLPAPLFLIYRQAASYSEFFDSELEVTITGDVPTEADLQQLTATTPHPLSVIIKFPSNSFFSIKFVYYPTLNIVTASTPNNAKILRELFANDTGISFPSVSSEHLLASANAQISDLEGAPYKWTQAICRLDHLSDDSTETKQQQTFQNFIKRVKSSLA